MLLKLEPIGKGKSLANMCQVIGKFTGTGKHDGTRTAAGKLS